MAKPEGATGTNETITGQMHGAPMHMNEEHVNPLNLGEQERQRQEDQEQLDGQERLRIEQERLRQEQERQHRDQQKARLQQIKASAQIVMPKETIQTGSYAREYKESVGSGKRNFRKGFSVSRLHTKEQNAQALETSQTTRANALREVRTRAMSTTELLPLQDTVAAQDLSNFYGEQELQTKAMYYFQKGTANAQSQDEVVKECVTSFINLDLDNLDMRTDAAIAKMTARFEDIVGKTMALSHMLTRNPAVMTEMSDDEKALLKEKQAAAYRIINYYRARKMVITNPYYRSHYNSEISYTYSENDSLEQRRLTMLLLRSESYLDVRGLEKSGDAALFENSSLQELSQDQQARNEEIRALFRANMSAGEYGKNGDYIADSPHAEYLRKLNVDGNPIKERLQAKKYEVTGYQVNGQPLTMPESFTRNIANLNRLRALWHISRTDLTSMINKLAATPSDTQDETQIARCRQENIDGLRSYKECIKRQMKYLKRKYGAGLATMNPEEVVAHQLEFENDFTDMQGKSEFLILIRKIPELFNEDDPEDRELSDAVDYYQMMSMTEGIVRNFFAAGQSSTFAESKAQIYSVLKNSDQKLQESFMTMENQHADIIWDTTFEEGAADYEETVRILSSQELIDKKVADLRKTGASALYWKDMFTEYNGMTDDQAGQRFWDKVKPTEDAIADKIAGWREGGIMSGSVRLPGIGTDDLGFISEVYNKIMKNPEIRVQYGITTDALFQEFSALMKENADAGEYLMKNDYYNNEALNMRDNLRNMAASKGNISKQLLRGLSNSITKISDKYDNEKHQYKLGRADSVYRKLKVFREKVNMWFYPEHAALKESVIEPLVALEKPDLDVLISDMNVRVFSGEMADLLHGKKLKDEVSPDDFYAAIEEYNTAYGRFKAYDKFVMTGNDEALQMTDPVWKQIPKHKGFFQYEMHGRTETVLEQVEAVKAKIKSMIQ